ncbi:copper resistance protein CopZ [bacterium]|nr:copper resistance protein CopZ [bacterium]
MKRLIVMLMLLAACKEDAALPLPVALTADSTGYFCQMDMLGHPGPKAQIHLATYPGKPLFFSQVRDAVAYLRMPEQIDTITATYVSDMGAAPSWADPGAANWIAADQAVYVVGSAAKGGMDAPEFVPFGDPAKARAFAAQNGGQVMTLAQIPAEAIAVSTPAAAPDADIAARLHALSDNGG